jgi:hypothetical protein
MQFGGSGRQIGLRLFYAEIGTEMQTGADARAAFCEPPGRPPRHRCYLASPQTPNRSEKNRHQQLVPLGKAGELHGLFNSHAEAKADAETTLFGEDCKISDGEELPSSNAIN